MDKEFLPLWQLQQMVQQLKAMLLPDANIFPTVHLKGDPIWDEECAGFGRSNWRHGFIAPEGMPPPTQMAEFNAAIARLQGRYDVGVTSDAITFPADPARR